MSIDWEKVENDIAAYGVNIFPFEECTIGYCLGSGGAMEVFNGQCKIDRVTKDVAFKRHMALKKYLLTPKDVNRALRDFRHEITLMKKLKYQANVVQIYGITFEAKKPILIVELGNETLSKYLLDKADSGTPATWREKIRLCEDISRGIRCLHDAGIIHGDIKGDNVLVFIKSTGIVTAKISDFGYSSSLSSSKGYIGGTLIYMSPEARGAEILAPYVKKQTLDIFSFGLVTYQIANDGKRPYIDDDEDSEDAEDGNDISKAYPSNSHTKILLSKLPPDTPDQFRTIIIHTTKYMPPERASLDDIERILYEYWNESSSQQVTTVTANTSLPSLGNLMLTSRISEQNEINNSNKEAKATFESFALSPSAVFDPNNLPISSSFKPSIFYEYQRLAEAGHVFAQYMLGTCWIYGFGTDTNHLKAAECFSMAAETDYVPAQNSLGFCYDTGIGVAKDAFKAIELYKKAAEAGNTKAQCNLGICYEIGNGVFKDISKSAKFYQMAAEAGDPIAQNNLGSYYEEGIGVNKSISKAIELFTKAAEAGYPLAQRNLLRLGGSTKRTAEIAGFYLLDTEKKQRHQR